MARTFDKIACAVTLVYFCTGAVAQFHLPFSSSYQAGLLYSDHFSIDKTTFNEQPSVLSRHPSPVISGNIQSLYTGFEIVAFGLHIASPLPGQFGAGVSIIRLGHPDYKVSEIFLGTARNLSPSTSIGIGQSFHTSKVGNEGRPWSGSTSIGGSFDQGSYGIAVHLDGLMTWSSSFNKKDMSLQVSSYILFQTSTHLYFSLGYANSNLRPLTGIRQKIINDVVLFGGFQWYPARYGLGFTLPLAKHLISILSTTYHPVLGWSPSIGLQWHTEKKRGADVD